LKRSLWKIGLHKHGGLKKPKTKPRNKQELEKEWLLLGEPTSPCPQREGRDVESTILSDGEPPVSALKIYFDILRGFYLKISILITPLKNVKYQIVIRLNCW